MEERLLTVVLILTCAVCPFATGTILLFVIIDPTTQNNSLCVNFVDTGLLVDIMNAGLIINSFGKKIPHCSVDTVTQAVMQLIEDPTYNGTLHPLLFALLLTHGLCRSDACCSTKRSHQEY